MYAPLTLLFLILAAIFLIRAAWGVYQSEQVSRQELQRAEQQQNDLTARQQFLQGEVGKFSSEQGLEQELRTKFPVVKEGEKMVIIVEPQDSSTSTLGTARGGLWQRFLDFFR